MKLKNQKGTAIVEFTIVLPLLLLIMLGIGEMGHFIYQFNSLNKCVRDGARYLSENSRQGSTGTIINLTSSPIVAQVKNMTVYGNPNGSGAALLPGFTIGNVTLAKDGENVRVIASYTYQPIFVPNELFNITFPTLVASVTMGAL